MGSIVPLAVAEEDTTVPLLLLLELLEDAIAELDGDALPLAEVMRALLLRVEVMRALLLKVEVGLLLVADELEEAPRIL